MEKLFSTLVLEWFDTHGRKHLPWQQNITPYRVWVSEIMLQQTQVATVITYFDRFMKLLPNIQSLADASLDDVLHLWSGLGYYSRARNLHKTSIIIIDKYGGVFPSSVEALTELPGIGRSTAGAIVSISMGLRAPILDGNVKRVLARYHNIKGWPGQNAISKVLWSIAETITPTKRVGDYTQAIMDLGAMICTRGKPACQICPLINNCMARITGTQSELPSPKPKKLMPEKAVRMLMAINQFGEVLLEKRPLTGIWGGLWSFPEVEDSEKLHGGIALKENLIINNVEEWKSFKHSFSHYHLHITPVKIMIFKKPNTAWNSNKWFWYQPDKPCELGLAAPVKKLIMKLQKSL